MADEMMAVALAVQSRCVTVGKLSEITASGDLRL